VPKNDSARVVSEEISDTFGSSELIIVGLEREYGTVFDAAFLAQIKEYVERVEKIEIVDTVTSIMTTDYITAEGDTIVVENLVGDGFSGTPEEIAELRRKLRSWDLYDHALVSDDFTAAQILIALDIDGEDAGKPVVMEAFRAIRGMARGMFEKEANVYVAGLPVISSTINEAVQADLIYLIPLVVLVVLVVLFISFRGFAPVALPLITVIAATIWAIGAMPLFGVKLTVLSTVLPVILVAVGSAYGIHIVTHYLEDHGDKKLSKEEHRELVYALMRKLKAPVLLAALTTFAGFASFCFTAVPPIREVGYFASWGVIASFIVAVTLIPALILIRGPKPVKKLRGTVNDPLSDAIADGFLGVAKKKRLVLILASAVTAFSLHGVSKVIIDNVFIEYFKTTTDVRRSDVFIREKFGGTKVVNIVVKARDSATLLSPEVLGAVDDMKVYLEGHVPNVGKVMGFTDMVKRTNQVFNADESPEGLRRAPSPDNSDTDFGFGFGDDTVTVAGDYTEYVEETHTADAAIPGIDIALLDRAAASPAMSVSDLVWEAKKLVNYEGASYYEIPVDPARYGKTNSAELSALVSNYLVLLSGSIDDYANDPLEPTAIKTTLQLRTTGDADTKAAIARMQSYIDANFPDTVKVSIGGSALVESSLSGLVVQSQIVSVIFSILMVFIIIAVSNKSLMAGLIGGLPLCISILINFAVMGFLGIKLNLGTSLVASVSVGIGIDYTIHFMDAYKREYRASNGQGDFLRRAFAGSGKAIMINAVSVGAGFAVLALSQFNILADLGLLVCLTMFTNALISLTVIPALLSVLNPRFVGGVASS
jgi:predicted RND superfamily exporter protein